LVNGVDSLNANWEYDHGVSFPARFPEPLEGIMTICPVAITAGCRKCPIVAVCPVRSVIGDYGKEKANKPGSAAGEKRSGKKD